MILAKDMVIEYSILIFIFVIFSLGVDCVAGLRHLICLPKVELLFFEQILAILLHAHGLGRVGIAPVIVYDFIQLLL